MVRPCSRRDGCGRQRNTPGGTFDVGSNTYSLRVEGEFKDPKEMENIVAVSYTHLDVYKRQASHRSAVTSATVATYQLPSAKWLQNWHPIVSAPQS